MKFILQRLFNTDGLVSGDYSVSHLTNHEGFESFAIEDDYNESKIAGQTRIPGAKGQGKIYELKIYKEDTPLTIKHRETYAKSPDSKWFKDNPGWFHIEITGIPNYQFVYFHSGIDDSHTLGCVLPCFAVDVSKGDSPGSRSIAATDKFYSIAYPLLESGKKVFLEVRDEII